MKKTKTTTVRIRQETKDRLDVLSRYLNRKLVDVIDDAIGSLQAKILLDELERQRVEKQWELIVKTLEGDKVE